MTVNMSEETRRALMGWAGTRLGTEVPDVVDVAALVHEVLCGDRSVMPVDGGDLVEVGGVETFVTDHPRANDRSHGAPILMIQVLDGVQASAKAVGAERWRVVCNVQAESRSVAWSVINDFRRRMLSAQGGQFAMVADETLPVKTGQTQLNSAHIFLFQSVMVFIAG